MFRKFGTTNDNPKNILLKLRQREITGKCKLPEVCYFTVNSQATETPIEKINEFLLGNDSLSIEFTMVARETESQAENDALGILKWNHPHNTGNYNQEFKHLPFDKNNLKKNAFWIVMVRGNAYEVSKALSSHKFEDIKDNYVLARNNSHTETTTRSQALELCEQSNHFSRP